MKERTVNWLLGTTGLLGISLLSWVAINVTKLNTEVTLLNYKMELVLERLDLDAE